MCGKSFSPGILKGGKKAENWTQQQLFCLDIDNEEKDTPKGEPKVQRHDPVTVPEVLRRCKEWDIAPALIYETFSSSEQWQKFRIAFVCDRLITDSKERAIIQLALMELFPECDGSCKNLDRLFFGGKSTLYINEAAAFDPVSINVIGKAAITPPEFRIRPVSSSDTRLDELKRGFDFLSYIRSFGGSERKAGKVTVFNPCPICGHNDDFCYYHETNTFFCFGSSGRVGGSVIDFIIHNKRIDKAAAIDYFKYELCGLSRAEEKRERRTSIMLNNAKASLLDIPDGALPPYIYEDIDGRTGEIKLKVSCPLLAKYIREHSHYIQIEDRLAKSCRMFWYEDGMYKPINDEMLQGYIKMYITAYDETLLKMGQVREVMQILKTDLTFVKEELLNADENIINFKNGLYSIRERKLYPHSPDVFSTIQIPCNYSPHSRNAPVFTGYLKELTGGDNEKLELLLEYMGVCISNLPGYRMKKALFMYGDGDTGKSQLLSLTEKLLGNDNFSVCDLSQLEDRFGTSQLYMKRLVGHGDMSFVSVNELELFKCITGGDPVFVEFKHVNGFRYKYTGLLWFCTNELPRFGGDRGDWVYNRIIAVDCPNVIPQQRQDKLLLEKMWSEREAIINLLIPALERVIDSGYRFAVPQACMKNNEVYKEQNSPVITFFNECCVMFPTERISSRCTTSMIHKIFKLWYKDNYPNPYRCPSPQQMKKEFAQILGVLPKDLVTHTRSGTFYPFSLSREIKEEYKREYGYDNSNDSAIGA